MQTLQQEVDKVANPKTTALTQEIRQLKTQVDCMETEIGNLQDKNKDLQMQLDVTKADYLREKDINTFLVQQGLSEKKQNNTDNSSVQPAPQENLNQDPKEKSLQTPAHSKEKESGLDKNEGVEKRDFCVHVFFEDTCRYTRCMFNHDISEANRKDKETESRILKKKNAILSRKSNSNTNSTTSINKDICETAFHHGPNSCKNTECDLEHSLDYRRIRKGICHFFVKGRCTRNDNCLFTHQLPKSVLTSPETIQAAERFIQNLNRGKPGDTLMVQDSHDTKLPDTHSDIGTKSTNESSARSLLEQAPSEHPISRQQPQAQPQPQYQVPWQQPLQSSEQQQQPQQQQFSELSAPSLLEQPPSENPISWQQPQAQPQPQYQVPWQQHLQNSEQQQQPQQQQFSEQGQQAPAHPGFAYPSPTNNPPQSLPQHSTHASSNQQEYYNTCQPQTVTYDPFLFLIKQMVQSQIQETYAISTQLVQ